MSSQTHQTAPPPRHTSRLRRVLRPLTGLLAAALATAGLTAPAHAAGGPFTCTPGFFQVISGQLKELNPVTGAYTPIGSAYADSYNAMGYDTLDNYLYAIDTSTGTNKGHLLRIASDGSVTDLGVPSGYPASTSSVAGDFDSSGDLIVQASNTTYYSINVAGMTATKLTISGATSSVDDLVWINGYMYGLYGTTTVYLLAVDLSTDVATATAVSGITSTDGAFGAGFSDKPNDLFFSDNKGTGIYSLTGYTTGSPAATYEAHGAVTGNNDGAACKLADSPFNGPTANPDSYTLLAGQAYSVTAAAGVLANDTGSEPLTVSSSTSPAHGTLTMSSDGSFTYTPGAGYSGPDSFTYVAQDPYGRTSSAATVSLTVLPAPQDQTDTTTLDTAYSAPAPGLLTNAQGSSLTVVSSTAPAHGSVSVSSDGAFTYTPDTGWSGTDPFQYTVKDSAGQTASATVTMRVLPSVQPDAYTVSGTAPLDVAAPGVLANDAGTGLSVTSSTAPPHGSVTVNGNGSLTYTADPGFSGVDTFQYTATDSSGLSGSATVTVQVAPTAGSPAYTVAAGTTLTVGAAQGVAQASDGTSLTAAETTGPAHGSLTLNPDGSFSYTPDTGYSGSDSFGFRVTDSGGQTADGTASIEVTPTAVDHAYTTPFQTGLGVPASSGALDGDLGSGLTASVLSGPSDGSLALAPDGSFTYTPDPGFTGTDSFTYRVTDGSGQTASATVQIAVGEPAAPVTAPQSYATSADVALSVAAPGLLSGDSGYDLTVSPLTGPTHGSLTVNANGSFTYTPDPGYSGPDGFTVTVKDPFGQSAPEQVEVAVTPVAVDHSYTTPFETQLTVPASSGALDGDLGSGLTASVLSGPGHGSLSLAADGSFTYTPDPGYAGADSFTYQATDSSGQTAAATVGITVGLPAPPVAVAHAYSIQADGSLAVGTATGLLQGDSGYQITVSGATSPAHGTVQVLPDGELTYTPVGGFSGLDSFSATVVDGFGQTATAAVTITVLPVASADTASTAYQTTLTVPAPGVLGNDVGSGLTVASSTAAAHGTLTVHPDGSFVYAPDAGCAGADTFQYTLSDQAGSTATATVTITVEPPAAPGAVPDSYTATAGATLTVDPAQGVLANDTGTGISVAGHTQPADGTVTVNADGSFDYLPITGYSGPDSFSYTITDSFSRTATALVSLTVDPVAEPVTASGAAPGPVTATPPEPDGSGPFTYRLTSLPPASQGTVSVDPSTGLITFSPRGTFTGIVGSFTYQVVDTLGDPSAAATVAITVGLPPPPTTPALAGRTPFGEPITLTPGSPNGTDPFAFALAGAPPADAGTASIDPGTGAVTFTPASGFSGRVPTFTYTVTDDYGQVSAPASVNVTVAPAAHPGSATGRAGEPVSAQLPTPSGTGPFTYELVEGSLSPAAAGTVTIDASTGTITLEPAPGLAGQVTVEYAVVDGDGVASSPASMTFEVLGISVSVPDTGAAGSPWPFGLGAALILLGTAIAVAARRRRRPA